MPTSWVSAGAWTANGDRIWRLAIESPGAAFLRVHFTGFHVGDGSVWVYSESGGDDAEAYTGGGLHGDGEFWSHVKGPSVVIEYKPGPAEPMALPFLVPEIMHNWSQTALAADNLSCAIDAMCKNTPPYNAAAVADSVAEMLYVDSGTEYQCTGTLLNSNGTAKPPYFLTAAHCISTNTVARTLSLNFHSEYNGVSFVPNLPGCENRLRDDNYGDGSSTVLVTRDFTAGDFTLLLLDHYPNISSGGCFRESRWRGGPPRRQPGARRIS